MGSAPNNLYLNTMHTDNHTFSASTYCFVNHFQSSYIAPQVLCQWTDQQYQCYVPYSGWYSETGPQGTQGENHHLLHESSLHLQNAPRVLDHNLGQAKEVCEWDWRIGMLHCWYQSCFQWHASQTEYQGYDWKVGWMLLQVLQVWM